MAGHRGAVDIDCLRTTHAAWKSFLREVFGEMLYSSRMAIPCIFELVAFGKPGQTLAGR